VAVISVITCVCVSSNCSQLLATCGYEDIRVWNLNDHCEILRITVPNMYCYAVTVTVDGKSIISGQSLHLRHLMSPCPAILFKSVSPELKVIETIQSVNRSIHRLINMFTPVTSNRDRQSDRRNGAILLKNKTRT